MVYSAVKVVGSNPGLVWVLPSSLLRVRHSLTGILDSSPVLVMVLVTSSKRTRRYLESPYSEEVFETWISSPVTSSRQYS